MQKTKFIQEKHHIKFNQSADILKMNVVSAYLHEFGHSFEFRDTSNLDGDVEYRQNDASCPHIDLYIENILVIGLYMSVFIIGVISNILGFYDTFEFIRARDSYIINLIIADICNLFSIPFLLIKMQFNEWIVVQEICKFVIALATIARLASKLFPAVIAADRWIGKI